jgi:hypothetical protein
MPAYSLTLDGPQLLEEADRKLSALERVIGDAMFTRDLDLEFGDYVLRMVRDARRLQSVAIERVS